MKNKRPFSVSIEKLAAKRLQVVNQIGRAKAALNLPVFDHARESHIKKKWSATCKQLGVNESGCIRILESMVEESRQTQQSILKQTKSEYQHTRTQDTSIVELRQQIDAIDQKIIAFFR